MATPNPYFPCQLVEQENDYSIICSHFHYFDDHFGDRGGGGYSVERLAKKLIREHATKGVKFDSEAGMFCAYSDTKGPLKTLCTKLRKITGGEKQHVAAQQKLKPSIPLPQAERLLIKGFVMSLDKLAQTRFLKHVPCPALSQLEAECLRLVQDGTAAEKIRAAKKINSQARTLVRKWDNYLSHPSTTKLLLDCCDANQETPAVVQEIIWALVFICDRHLPDLRTQPYFLAALESNRQQMRWLGILGLHKLHVLTPELVKPFLKDKSSNVRKAAKEHLARLKGPPKKYPSWMFDRSNVGQ